MSQKQSRKLRRIVSKIAGQKIQDKVDSDFAKSMRAVQDANTKLKRKIKFRTIFMIVLGSIDLVLGTLIVLAHFEVIW